MNFKIDIQHTQWGFTHYKIKINNSIFQEGIQNLDITCVQYKNKKMFWQYDRTVLHVELPPENQKWVVRTNTTQILLYLPLPSVTGPCYTIGLYEIRQENNWTDEECRLLGCYAICLLWEPHSISSQHASVAN
jgi:hypothetical protein